MRLGDFNLDKEFLEGCNKLSIKLLAFYAKGQLSRQEERLIDIHCINCSHCRGNLAYVFEIIKGREALSVDQQTLLLKYLQDSIYKQSLEKLKDDIKQEVLSEIKATLLAESLLPKSISLTNELIKKHFETNPNLESASTNSTYKIPSNDSNGKKAFVFLNTLKATFRKITNQKLSYSYFVSACLLAVLLSLTAFTYLALNSKPKQQPSTSSLSSYQNPFIQNITQQDKQTTTNLYQDLDIAIDQYLSSKNIGDLNKAEAIAKDIERNYDDKYGTDLVAYYQTVPSTALEKLLIAHKSLVEMASQATGDNYQQRLMGALNLEREFFTFGNLIEAYKTKTITNKLYVQLHNYKESELLTEKGLSFSIDKHYKFLQVNFLLWKAKRLCEIPDFINAEDSFLEVISLADKLNLFKVLNSAGSSLTMLYYRNDDNEKALELSKKLLANFTDYKNAQAITLLQIAGLVSFNLGYFQIADSYLKDAVKYSQQIDNPSFTVRSYAFSGLILSQQNKFVEADNFYLLAEAETNKIQDDAAKLEASALITGYKAKAMLLKGDYQQALTLYQHKLFLINKLNLGSNLELSQVNEAMAIALEALGQKNQAQEHTAIAKHYQNIAESNKERTNCLLSLVPTNCSGK